MKKVKERERRRFAQWKLEEEIRRMQLEKEETVDNFDTDGFSDGDDFPDDLELC